MEEKEGHLLCLSLKLTRACQSQGTEHGINPDKTWKKGHGHDAEHHYSLARQL